MNETRLVCVSAFVAADAAAPRNEIQDGIYRRESEMACTDGRTDGRAAGRECHMARFPSRFYIAISSIAFDRFYLERFILFLSLVLVGRRHFSTRIALAHAGHASCSFLFPCAIDDSGAAMTGSLEQLLVQSSSSISSNTRSDPQIRRSVFNLILAPCACDSQEDREERRREHCTFFLCSFTGD